MHAMKQRIYFIRHGEGFHNIGYEGNLDAHLTPYGWHQAEALGQHIRNQQPPLGIQVLSCALHVPSMPLSYTAVIHNIPADAHMKIKQVRNSLLSIGQMKAIANVLHLLTCTANRCDTWELLANVTESGLSVCCT